MRPREPSLFRAGRRSVCKEEHNRQGDDHDACHGFYSVDPETADKYAEIVLARLMLRDLQAPVLL
ncbi:MAG: hypothetical protein ACP5LW_06480 [Nitrososphaeria archaeon]